MRTAQDKRQRGVMSYGGCQVKGPKEDRQIEKNGLEVTDHIKTESRDPLKPSPVSRYHPGRLLNVDKSYNFLREARKTEC